MRNIIIQVLIVIIGILLSIVCFNGIKKYFYNNYKQEKKYILAYNNYSNISFHANLIEPVIKEKEIIEDESTSTTTKKTQTTTTNITTTSTTTSTTTLITTTTINPTEVFENSVTEPDIKEEGKIIYDGLTLTELIEKLDKNLTSTLTGTGHYFANYYVKTGLDPYLAVAIVLQETGCKWTCSKLVRNCNNIGGMKGNPKCNGGSYIKYETLEEGIYGYLDMLYNNYYAKGLTTPELMNPKYATSTSWSTSVNKYIDTIKAS